MKLTELCPCQSGRKFKNCCSLYLEDGKLAPDPEALLRSRYTAFIKGSTEYLKKTWHPETCPEDLSDEPSDWIHLEVIETGITEDETEGEVEYLAKLIYDNKLETVHEVSQFLKVDGKWLYHSGEFVDEEENVEKISRHDLCPCGSKKKFKNCHGVH